MIEPATSNATRDAIARAHAERGAALTASLRWVRKAIGF